jgi:hypothetical protein
MLLAPTVTNMRGDEIIERVFCSGQMCYGVVYIRHRVGREMENYFSLSPCVCMCVCEMQQD